MQSEKIANAIVEHCEETAQRRPTTARGVSIDVTD